MTFQSLHLARPLVDALDEAGYEAPTPIQAQAIPPVMEGHDLLGCAQTGTGKTAAFALPILHNLLRPPSPGAPPRRGPRTPRVLVLSPTRELASQIGESFDDYGRYAGLRHTVIFGGVSQFHQVRRLRAGVDILVATPGRLLDLMEQGAVDLRRIEVLVLDEADRMLDMGFVDPIRRISAAVPTERQTLLFSATMPKTIERLADALLRNPVKVTVTPVASAAPKIEQSLYMVEHQDKPALLHQLLSDSTVLRALVFTRTKHGADKLCRKLAQGGISADAIHGNKSQGQRTRALDAFKSGRSRVLVATDVAARGLDVDGVTHVFNYSLPNEPEAYVHRIGRTGRAGASGVAIAFCDREERGSLRAIEQLLGGRLSLAPGGAVREAGMPGDTDRSSGGGTPQRDPSPGDAGGAPTRRRRRRKGGLGRTGEGVPPKRHGTPPAPEASGREVKKTAGSGGSRADKRRAGGGPGKPRREAGARRRGR